MSLISVDFYEFKKDPVANLVWFTTKPLFTKTPHKISHCNLVLEFGGNKYTVVTSNNFNARVCDRDTFNKMYESPVYSHVLGETNLTYSILNRLISCYRGSILGTALWRLTGYYLGKKPKLCTTLTQEILRSSGYMVQYKHKPIDFYKELKNENYHVIRQSAGWEDPCCESDCRARILGWNETSIAALRKAYQR
jgi:hypothetical protein